MKIVEHDGILLTDSVLNIRRIKWNAICFLGSINVMSILSKTWKWKMLKREDYWVQKNVWQHYIKDRFEFETFRFRIATIFDFKRKLVVKSPSDEFPHQLLKLGELRMHVYIKRSEYYHNWYCRYSNITVCNSQILLVILIVFDDEYI